MTEIITKARARKAGELVALQDLDAGDCRWPVGDPRHGPFGFCGAPRAGHGPYCEAHRQQAHVVRDGKGSE